MSLDDSPAKTRDKIAHRIPAARSGDNPYPHAEFARQLRALMVEKHISASDLARGVWGTMKDTRGYEVARNRDRISHYLSGKSYPEAANRVKIAKVLGVDVQTLNKYQPAPVIREPGVGHGPNDVFVSFEDGAMVLTLMKMKLSTKAGKTVLETIANDPIRKKALAKKASE